MKCFSIGFLLISLSYLVWAIINVLALSSLQQLPAELSLQKAFALGVLGIFLHMALYSIGLITLTYATITKRNPKIYYLLLGLGLTAIVASANKIITFRIVSVFLLSAIVYHFFVKWKENGNRNLFYSFIAFSLLLLSNLEFALATNSYMAYTVGHFLELAAYLIILRNLVKITIVNRSHPNEQKKNKT